jgi:hypothetical protein
MFVFSPNKIESPQQPAAVANDLIGMFWQMCFLNFCTGKILEKKFNSKLKMNLNKTSRRRFFSKVSSFDEYLGRCMYQYTNMRIITVSYKHVVKTRS